MISYYQQIYQNNDRKTIDIHNPLPTQFFYIKHKTIYIKWIYLETLF